MPASADSSLRVFALALLGQTPTPEQLASLNHTWATAVNAALTATPEARQAAMAQARAGETRLAVLCDTLTRKAPPEPPAEAPWPQPQPIGQPELPAFPTDALPDWLAAYVQAEARATQTPPDLPAILALAVLSAALAGHVEATPWDGWTEPINLYLMVVLPPGHRKSAVFADVTQPLQQRQNEAAARAAEQIATAKRQRALTEAALKRAQRAHISAPAEDRPALLAQIERHAEQLAHHQRPTIPRLIVDDCSPERLAMLLHEQHGRLAILSPEGGFFDMLAGRYGTTGAPNLDHVLKGHAGDPIIVDRVDRPGEIIPRPALTIGLAVQPETLRGLIARPGFHGRGLLARFLYALPGAHLGHRDVDAPPVPAPLRDEYRRRVHTLLTAFIPNTEQPGTQAVRTTVTPHAVPADLDTPSVSPPSASAPPPHAVQVDPDTPAMPPASASAPPPHDPRSMTHHPRSVPFRPDAAARLRDFARAIEPRLAPTGDLEPLVDWGSKLVGAVVRLSALLHLAAQSADHSGSARPGDSLRSTHPAELPLSAPRSESKARRQHAGPGSDAQVHPCHIPAVTPEAVESAIRVADYLVAHAQAAYAAMGADPLIANTPILLGWLRRARLTTFTRRDAHRAIGHHLRTAADLDDALERLEHHHYIRQRPIPRRPGAGRHASPIYDVNPALIPS